MSYSIGVDIGGTKIATVLMNRKKEIIKTITVKSDPSSKEAMFKQVLLAINKLLDETSTSLEQVNGMGVGVPGKVDRERGIAVYQNNLPWDHFPLVKRLQEYYSFKKVMLDNDVYLATLAEWEAAKMEEESTFVYMTVSTGISCATIHQGRFIRGAGFAGEIGLIPVQDESSNGVNRLENVASGPAIKRLGQRSYQTDQLETKDIFDMWKKKDQRAKQIISHIEETLAQAIYSVICLMNPHRIVLGGGVINNNPDLLIGVKEGLKELIIKEQSQSLNCLSLSHYKENSGVVGAGILGFLA